MGARDGATQGVLLHMIYDDNAQIRILYNYSWDPTLVPNSRDKYTFFCHLD